MRAKKVFLDCQTLKSGNSAFVNFYSPFERGQKRTAPVSPKFALPHLPVRAPMYVPAAADGSHRRLLPCADGSTLRGRWPARCRIVFFFFLRSSHIAPAPPRPARLIYPRTRGRTTSITAASSCSKTSGGAPVDNRAPGEPLPSSNSIPHSPIRSLTMPPRGRPRREANVQSNEHDGHKDPFSDTGSAAALHLRVIETFTTTTSEYRAPSIHLTPFRYRPFCRWRHVQS